jgi:hypothetical protein
MHIKQLIAFEFQDRHKFFCYKYKNARSLEEIDLRYVVICSWWYSFGAASEGAIKEFSNWLSFWHFHVKY